MRRIATLPALCVAVLLVASCLACTTRIHHRDAGTIASYRTWAWLPATRTDDAEIDEAVRAAVENELSLRGFVEPAEADGLPDVWVVYRIWTRPEAEIRTGRSPSQHLFSLHSGPSYTISGHESHLRVYEKGTLAVDVVDARSGLLLWRSVDTRKARDSYHEDIPAAVASLLSHFPKATGKARPQRADDGPDFESETIEVHRDPESGLAAR